jgi:hypothetical protein
MSYGKRKREVVEELDKQSYDEATKSDFTKVLESYFAQREGRLENLLEVLEPSDEDRHGQWLEKAKDAAAGQDAPDDQGTAEGGEGIRREVEGRRKRCAKRS